MPIALAECLENFIVGNSKIESYKREPENQQQRIETRRTILLSRSGNPPASASGETGDAYFWGRP